MTRPGVAVTVFTLLFASSGFSQPLGTGINGSPDVPLNHVGNVPNPVPGGLTLVPGTVVVPGVSGAANTGTIPLPGTIGTPGLGTVIPRVPPGTGGGLYPPAYYPAIPPSGTVQSTVSPDAPIPDSAIMTAPAGTDRPQ